MSFVWEFSVDRRVIGVDECGVGPIAGPLFAAAVLLPEREQGADVPELSLVRDSKTLREDTVYAAAQQVISYASRWACLSIAVHPDLSKWPLKLMACAAERVTHGCGVLPLIAVDGDRRLPISHDQRVLVQGDRRCLEIACASVVAKHLRDEHMRELDMVYPQYGFAKHKGYPTKEHVEAVRKHGMSPVHRIGPTEKALATYAGKAG